MNYTWLKNYGAILSSELKFQNIEEFFEFIAVAHKIIDPQLKPISCRLRLYEKPINDLKFFTIQKRVLPKPVDWILLYTTMFKNALLLIYLVCKWDHK